jgi:hypothetical protein
MLAMVDCFGTAVKSQTDRNLKDEIAINVNRHITGLDAASLEL